MDRRQLIQSLSSTAIAVSVAGCQESVNTDATQPSDTTHPSDTDDNQPSENEDTQTQDPDDDNTPNRAPKAGEVPTDIREHLPDRARVIREFLPGTSSVSLAVGLPTADTSQKQAYCFDAVNCYLRYAWQGDLLSITWSKEDGPAEVLGETYHEVGVDQALRFGNPSEPPETRTFSGYTMVDGYPTFHYDLDGVNVDHRIVSADDGLSLQHQLELAGVESSVYFLTDGSAEYTASAGEWTNDTLRVSPGDADTFTVTLEGGE